VTAGGRQRFYPAVKNGNGEGAKRRVGEKTKSQANKNAIIRSKVIISKMIFHRFTVSPFHRFRKDFP